MVQWFVRSCGPRGPWFSGPHSAVVPVVQLLPTNPIPELDSGCIPHGTGHVGSCSVLSRKARVKIHRRTASQSSV